MYFVSWVGGEERWGSQAKTWEPLDPMEAKKSWGRGLPGSKILITYKKGQTVLAKVGAYNSKARKYSIEYIEDSDSSHNEHVDLRIFLGGGKQWRFVN